MTFPCPAGLAALVFDAADVTKIIHIMNQGAAWPPWRSLAKAA